MTTLSVRRVFTDQFGNYGNPVGIVVDIGNRQEKNDCQRIATNSGFSETVFIDITTRKFRIFTPQQEIPFAGHAVVGLVAFLSEKLQEQVTQVSGSEGVFDSWSEDGLIWVKAEIRLTPPWWHERLNSPEEINNLKSDQFDSSIHTQLWAWIDEKAGIVRSRTFAPAWGIPEDEANGSGGMQLAATLGRKLIIHHGEGSVIHARPSVSGYAEVGGLVALAEDMFIA